MGQTLFNRPILATTPVALFGQSSASNVPPTQSPTIPMTPQQQQLPPMPKSPTQPVITPITKDQKLSAVKQQFNGIGIVGGRPAGRSFFGSSGIGSSSA